MSTLLADWIRALRQNLGLTQERLAFILNTDRMNVSTWERGEHRPSPCFQWVLEAIDQNPDETLTILSSRPEPMPGNIAERAVKLQKKLGLSQLELATILRTDERTLFRATGHVTGCAELTLWVLEQYADKDPVTWPFILKLQNLILAKPPLSPKTIAAIRKSFMMTQREIAYLLGVGASTFGSWEVGNEQPYWCADLLLKMLEEFPGPMFDLLETARRTLGSWPAERFQKVREGLGMTQEELAALLNTVIETIQRHETGKKPIRTECDAMLFSLLEGYPEQVVPMIQRVR